MRYRSLLFRCLLLINYFGLISVCLAQTPPSQRQQAERLHQLGQTARQMLNRQQPDSAFRFAIEPGLPILALLPDTLRAARQFRYEMLSTQRRLKWLNEVIPNAQNLLTICQRANDRALAGLARRTLSMAYSDLGLYKNCIRESLTNVLAFSHPPDHDMLARTYAVLAYAYQQLKDDTK